MIVVLADELQQLILRRSKIFRCCTHGIDVWNLRPNDESELVGQIVDMLVVLIVRQSNGGCANLRDKTEVTVVIVRGRSPTVIKQVLMPVHPTKVEIIPV